MIRMTQIAPSVAIAVAAMIAAGDSVADDLLVSQHGRAFDPTEISIAVGQTLTIVNDDEFIHHAVVEGDGFEFDSGIQELGDEVEITFDEEGLFNVRCDIHPKMSLLVTVAPE